MSYQIDSVSTPVLKATMAAKDVLTLHEQHRGEMAEGNFLNDMLDAAVQALAKGDPEQAIPLPDLSWYGDGSGSSYKPVLLGILAPRIRGEVEAILCWEGGDSVTGLLIKDGQAVECDVEQRLVKPEGW